MNITTCLLLVFLSINSVKAQENSDMKKSIVGGMEYVIIQHEVSDYHAWKKQFDADAAVQQDAGLNLIMLLQASDNPNSITVIFEYKNKEKIDAFFANPKLAERMQSAGVISKPIFTFFKTQNSGIPAHSAFLLVQHTVADFETWKKAFDDDENSRAEYKLSLVALGKNVKENDKVVVLINSSEVSNILDFLQNSGLEEKMKSAGVESEPTINILTVL